MRDGAPASFNMTRRSPRRHLHGLDLLVTRLPVLRGSVGRLKDTLIRGAAILTAVAFIIIALSAALAWVLDRLERRKLYVFVVAPHRAQRADSHRHLCVLHLAACHLVVRARAASSA